MPIRYQDTDTADALRYRVFQLKDLGTITIAAASDVCLIQGLNGEGGTIVGIHARCLTTPTGTVSATRYDININGTSIFSTTTSGVYFTMTAAGAAATTVPYVTAGGAFSGTRAGKVYNRDIITLDCDAKADGAAGANCAVTIIVRVDEPND